METYILRNQLVIYGKVKDLMHYLTELSNKYHTLQELVESNLH